MYIMHRIRQHRRDFTARYRCEFCGAESEGGGYDDWYFHREVIPNMACGRCKKVSGIRTSEPIVPEGVVL